MCFFCEELLVFWAIANNLQNSTLCTQGDFHQTDILNLNADSWLLLERVFCLVIFFLLLFLLFCFLFFKGKGERTSRMAGVLAGSLRIATFGSLN